MFGDAINDQFIALEGLEGVLMDRLLRPIHSLSSIAKGCDVVYPCRSREEDYRNSNDCYGQEPQSPRDAPDGCRVTHNVHPMPVGAERLPKTKPNVSCWVPGCR